MTKIIGVSVRVYRDGSGRIWINRKPGGKRYYNLNPKNIARARAMQDAMSTGDSGDKGDE